jgi:hypothetical protein
MTTTEFLGVNATPIFSPPLPTNSPLAPPYVFLGYSPHHKGYVCLDRHTNRTIISHHVVFDETSFPFAEDSSPPPAEAFDFLEDTSNTVMVPFPPSMCSPPASTPPDGQLPASGVPPLHRGRPLSTSGGPLPPLGGTLPGSGGTLPLQQQPPPAGSRCSTTPAPSAPSPFPVVAPAPCATAPSAPLPGRFGITYTRRRPDPLAGGSTSAAPTAVVSGDRASGSPVSGASPAPSTSSGTNTIYNIWCLTITLYGLLLDTKPSRWCHSCSRRHQSTPHEDARQARLSGACHF